MGRAPFTIAAAAGLALFALAAPAGAQVPDPFARQLAQQLARAEILTRDRGLAHVAGPLAGVLAPGQATSFPVTLRAGSEYAVVGVCDQRCGDLDLRLTDEFNEIFSEGAFANEAPVIGVRPVRTGVYRVEVMMVRCAASACYFALNVYGR